MGTKLPDLAERCARLRLGMDGAGEDMDAAVYPATFALAWFTTTTFPGAID
jgi:hypothetical protein